MLATSRILFLIGGLFWLAIGVLTPLVVDRWTGPTGLFISVSTDTALYGAPPDQILASNPEVTMLRRVMIRVLAGLLVATGLFAAGVAWFGLREPQTWALALLTVVGLAVLPYWWITLGPYRAAGIRVGLGDMPPFMWVPGMLFPVAAVLGWIAHLRA